VRRQVVVEEELLEASVHPNGVYANLVRAFNEAASDLLVHKNRFIDSPCPACGSSESCQAFEKLGFIFRECGACGSLFTSPRPNRELMESYLRESVAAKYRSSDEYRSGLQARTVELARYRADWIASLCERVGPPSGPIAIFEPGGPELMASIVESGLAPVVAVRPLGAAREAATGQSGWTVAEELGAEGASGARLLAVFDVLERQTAPGDLLAAAWETLAPGGCLALTTRCGGGFDIQVAWDRATVFPVEHMNLPTVEGMENLLGRLGFEVLEMSTPGQLDVQMVERLAAEDGVELPRFVRYFLGSRDQLAKQRLQQFLQQNLLSSHLRVVARKGDGGPPA
jgi:Zn ribbon nucleic-acid-binding protein